MRNWSKSQSWSKCLGLCTMDWVVSWGWMVTPWLVCVLSVPPGTPQRGSTHSEQHSFIHWFIQQVSMVCIKWGWGELTVPCGNKSLKLHFQPGITIHSPKSLDLILRPLPPSNVTFNLLFGLLNLGFLTCEYLTTGEHRHWRIRKGVGPSHALEWFEIPSFCWCM